MGWWSLSAGFAREFFDEVVLDEQLSSRADVDGIFGEGEAADDEQREDGEGCAGHGVAPGSGGLGGATRVFETRNTKHEIRNKSKARKSEIPNTAPGIRGNTKQIRNPKVRNSRHGAWDRAVFYRAATGLCKQCGPKRVLTRNG